MKSVKTLLIYLAILTVLIIISCVWSTHKLSDGIALAANLIAGITGLGTIVLGYVIYVDIGLSKKIADKQSDAVLAYFEELRTLNIHLIHFHDPDYLRWQRIEVSKSFLNSFKKENKLLPLPVSFDVDNLADKIAKLTSLAESIYIPKDLKPKLVAFDVTPLRQIDPKAEQIRVGVNGGYDNNKIWWTSDPEMTLEQFLGQLSSTLAATKDWLDSHADTGDLAD